MSATIQRREPRQPRYCNGVFERVGPGYLTSPAILAAMGVLRRDLDRTKDSLEELWAALAEDGGDGCELIKVRGHLASTRASLVDEMRRHSEYLASGEPERLAAEENS